jgi:hypothetical protein
LKIYKNIDKDMESLIRLINKIKNEIGINNNKLIIKSIEYNNLHFLNKLFRMDDKIIIRNFIII